MLPTKEDAADSMAELVKELAQAQASGRDDPQLLQLADRLRNGAVGATEVQEIKLRAIAFVKRKLRTTPSIEQSAFLYFILRSEIVDDWTELRLALFDAIRPSLAGSLDKLALDVSAALLESAAPPTSNLLTELKPRLLQEYRSDPSWRFVGALVALVDRPDGISRYDKTDLIQDLRRLADQDDFDKNVQLRDAIWRSVDTTWDAISVRIAVRARQKAFAAHFPSAPNFEPAMQSSRRTIAS